MTTLYTLPDPLPAEPRKDCVYAVIYRWPDGQSWTLHRTLASATGRVGGIIGQAPAGEWYRVDSEPYLWKRCKTWGLESTIVVEEREVVP